MQTRASAQPVQYILALLLGVLIGGYTLNHNLFLLSQNAFMAQDLPFWRDIATTMHQGYLPYEILETTDNKPPMMFVILFVYAIFDYTVAHAVGAAVAIGLLGVLFYLVALNQTTWWTSLVGTLFFAWAISSLHLLENGIRPWAIVCVLGGLLAVQHQKPRVAGISIALGGLIWQQAGLALIPMVLLCPNRAMQKRLLITTATLGIGIILLFQLLVPQPQGAIWYSILITVLYAVPDDIIHMQFAPTSDRFLFDNPKVWASFLWSVSHEILPTVWLGALGTLYARPILVGLVLSFLPFLSKAHTTYFYLLLPWVALGLALFLFTLAQEIEQSLEDDIQTLFERA